jgi:CRISPR-associated endonuclease/helicase Cas3
MKSQIPASKSEISNLRSEIYTYWGKASPDYPGEPKWHPLVYHCLDVAAVTATWWDSSPAIRHAFISAFGFDKEKAAPLRAWALFFITLHDMGKFDVRFQLKAPDAIELCWPDLNLDDLEITKNEVGAYDHGTNGFAWIRQEFFACLNIEGSYQDLFDAWEPWFAAVTGHHGEIPIYRKVYPPEGENYVGKHDQSARKEWLEQVSRIFLHPVGLDLKNTPPACSREAQALLAGFCSVSDWIGSNAAEEAFAYRHLEASPENYFSNQMEMVKSQDLLRKYGLMRNIHPYSGISTLLENGNTPRGVQTLVDQLPSTPGFTLMEAPTGSGKTEAALAYAWRLLETGYTDSIIFALPTQATANAMLKRAEEFAEKAFGLEGANLVLAHGKRNFNHEFQALVEAGRSSSSAQNKEDASIQCAEWLAQSRKRVFLGQIGICTVDQVLLGVLPVRHKFVRGFGLHKSVLIVDEVHAYDSYMHGLLGEVLRRQMVTGGSAILLSATLPFSQRMELLKAWGCKGGDSGAYPLITHSSGNNVISLVPAHAHRPERREVYVECLKLTNAFPNENLLQRIVKAGESGARVVVIMNLVDEAQKLAESLQSRTKIPVDIFHARYRFKDRQHKEHAALNHYGKNREGSGGRILVATQVVEQSLDLDFDWMVTQICPVDLLFQRLGRLHRHQREEWERPAGFQEPKCTVMTFPDQEYGLLELIYRDASLLWRTEQLLLRAKGSLVRFPDAYRKWINAVYRNKSWYKEPEAITGSACANRQYQRQMDWEAKRLTTISMTQFRDEDSKVLSLTRDGEMGLTVVPVLSGGRFLDGTKFKGLKDHKLSEEFNFNSVPAPSSWENILRGCEKDKEGRHFLEFVEDGEDGWIGWNGKIKFRYSRIFGLEKE